MRTQRRKGLRVFLIILCAVIVVFLFVLIKPLDADVKGYTAPDAAAAAEQFPEPHLLTGMQEISIDPYARPETVVYRDGWLYASVHGPIIRVRPEGGTPEVVVEGEGETLGFDFDPEGNLIFCDLTRNGTPGIYKADLHTLPAKVSLVTSEVDGYTIRYPNAVAVSSDGKIYISEATEFSALDYGNADDAFNQEYWYHSCSGKVLSYDPKSGEGKILASGLSFANGIALTPDEKNLLVNETAEFSIWKISVLADHAEKGDEDFLLVMDNLPGFPDNLTAGQDSLFWCGLTSPRNTSGDQIISKPLLRKILMTVYPGIMDSKGETVSSCISFHEDGTPETYYLDQSGSYTEITGVCQTPEGLFFHTNNTLKQIGFIPDPA